ncbi:hypothetical protein K461DRAFT_277509 [Myriangium duriaei CBS 260.36]|uniref:Uncharacterized protein n=1 Tax=Myriangium duriaei CBS 260.36 TaxID=1168546 RepID=A0A9P4J4E2_9PEZI|nr:hypothetical protein K461DRAFT_277509 [Myriangium duriaei CBS 260.36]
MVVCRRACASQQTDALRYAGLTFGRILLWPCECADTPTVTLFPRSPTITLPPTPPSLTSYLTAPT